MVCVKEEVTRRVKKISGNASSLYVIAVAVRGNDAAFAGAGKREDASPALAYRMVRRSSSSLLRGWLRAFALPSGDTHTHLQASDVCARTVLDDIAALA